MPDDPIKGYVRAEGLSIFATEAVLNKAKPLSGYLDIGTEDGRLRLRMNGCAAADLLVELKHFLTVKQKDDYQPPACPAARHRIAGADRGHHRARDDRADARDRHQSLAAFVLTSQRFDLAGAALNARIEAAPVCRQVFEDTQHAGRERIGSRRKDARQLGPQETQPLPHRDAALQHG